ncbi:MAG: hypothetical protein L3V56_14370 [Candidatus Magnetoovum sp. WYHC-5]|nr:hypothetical protein [Candidatus Magnetoovum sp. WYHC-5]
MVEILNILVSKGVCFYDKQLSWGAALTEYEEELTMLAPNIIPVFIELNLDCRYPENSIIVDHHGQKASKYAQTSIEQVATLLRVKLNRHQQLISANDKGHIRAMIALNATNEEIAQIRQMDRKAQGVTEEDEKNAEISIKNHIEIINGNCAIVQSLTRHSSCIFDRIYDKFDYVFIYTPKGQLHYSGKGHIVQYLVELYKKQKTDNKSIDFWWGGSLPDYGFFGTDAPLDKQQIKLMFYEIQQLEAINSKEESKCLEKMAIG